MKAKFGRPSYSNVTATLALVVALGGTSYAAIQIPKNSVGSPQIKKASVKSSDVKDDGLKGKDIKESTLAKVPSAVAADTLGGKTLRGISQWVLVRSDGIIVSQSGGVSSVPISQGRFRITFASDVSACGLNATAGTSLFAGDGTNFSPRSVMLGRSSTGVTDVQVEVVDEAGTEVNSPFFLTALC